MLIREKPDNLDDCKVADGKNCSVCKDLLVHLERFLALLETARRPYSSDWLTVDAIASELKVLKSIVYRLIRRGELEAVNIVVPDKDDGIAKKGHYRVRRDSLSEYLNSKNVYEKANHPGLSR